MYNIVKRNEGAMNKEKIQEIIIEQKRFFNSGKTKNIRYRVSALKTLLAAFERHEDDICKALYLDLGKSRTESYMSEIGTVKEEIKYMIRNTTGFARKKRVRTPITQQIGKSYVMPTPYGRVLIMSPWNYPFVLTFEPLADAIAAGNVAMVKPSAYAPESGKVIKKIIEEGFEREYVFVVTGGREENNYLLEEKFDMIFFTGSKSVGRIVMEKASRHLTPVVLELGGKSPCIVHKDADLDVAARRIVWGKYLNCGQTCVAPDYLYCHVSIKDELEEKVIAEIKRQYGSDPINNSDYGKIINEKHFTRLLGLVPKSNEEVYGGNFDMKQLKIEPTVISNVGFEDNIMQEEIFGPILPILTYENLYEAIDEIAKKDKPLALYVFTENEKMADNIINRIDFGGGCINDTIIHLASTKLPFGGMGESGMGMYHGKYGFDAFSHMRGIVSKSTKIDIPVRYRPFTSNKKHVLEGLF